MRFSKSSGKFIRIYDANEVPNRGVAIGDLYLRRLTVKKYIAFSLMVYSQVSDEGFPLLVLILVSSKLGFKIDPRTAALRKPWWASRKWSWGRKWSPNYTPANDHGAENDPQIVLPQMIMGQKMIPKLYRKWLRLYHKRSGRHRKWCKNFIANDS